jgi:hypothetical protein
MREFESNIRNGLQITTILGRKSVECLVQGTEIMLEHYSDGRHNYSSNELEYGQKWYEVEESKTDFSCLKIDYSQQNEHGKKAFEVIKNYFGEENAQWLVDYVSN